MLEQTTVLFANEAYYAAFQGGNYDMMETLWARSVPVSCIHPGANNLLGWDSVMGSWKSILGNGDLPDMEIVNPVANVYGEIAVVICYEVFKEEGELVLYCEHLHSVKYKDPEKWKDQAEVKK